jgi:hypothetical protein
MVTGHHTAGRLECCQWWPVTVKAVVIRVMHRAPRQGARRSHSDSYGDDEQRRIGVRGAPWHYRFGCYRSLVTLSSVLGREVALTTMFAAHQHRNPDAMRQTHQVI